MVDPVNPCPPGAGADTADGGLFELFMHHLPGVACIKGADGRYLYVNDTWETVYGLPPGQTLGRLNEELWPPDLAPEYTANDRRVLQGRETVRLIERTRGQDGMHYWLCHKFPIPAAAERDTMLGVVAVEVTDRVRVEERLRRANRVLGVLSGINSAIVRIHDRKALLDEACRIAVEPGQFRSAWIALSVAPAAPIELAAAGVGDGARPVPFDPARAIAGSPLVDQALRDRRPLVRRATELDADRVLGEWAADGGAIALLPLVVEGVALGVVGLLAAESDAFDEEEMKVLEELAGDVSFALDYIDKQERLAYLVLFDAMTDLPNRTLFLDRLAQQLHARQSAPVMLGVIAFDIERFGILINTLGRHAGDAVLRQVAQRLRATLVSAGQDPDHVARIGADSFAVLVTEAQDEGDVARILDRTLLPALDEPFSVDGIDLRISVKAGISLFPNDGGDAETLFRNAETSLRRAEAGDERYLFFTDQMQARITGRLSLENRLRKALAAGEFVLHYQPKMSLGNGRLAGLEALIRWNDPEHGLRQACDFVPILEETGLVVEAGAWALERAMRDYRGWVAKGLRPPRIAVNVSPAQLGRRSFVAELSRLVAADGNEPPGLDLEILESTVMQDIEDSITKLREVREMGVGVAIDDFGTGYSSLAYIARLPMSAIKIDRSFITPMATDPNDVAVVTAIISLAHAMSVKVIAEGVDSDQQSNLLRLLRCDEAQGFLYSPALPPQRIEEMLAAA